MSDAEQRVINGAVWDEFCDALKDAGKILKSEKAPQDAFNQAEGYRYLTRMLRGGLESFLEHSDKNFPQLRCGCHETIKMGADNPDNYYQSAPLDPNFDYKITGTRGTVDYLGLSTVINKYATGGGMHTTGFIDSREMEISKDGSLDVIISQNEHKGNWLPMGSQANSINVRQTFQDRLNEKRAELTIQRIDADNERPQPLSAEKLEKSLQGTIMFLKGTTGLFENWSESFIPITNQLPPADQAYCQAIGGDPNIYYFHSAWKLADDECLVIEADEIPECQTWNFQLDNWWMESLDYRHHVISINKHTAKYEADGSVKVIVSHTNPGVDNWIETAGHSNGTMCWRWIGAKNHPCLNTRVVKLADL